MKDTDWNFSICRGNERLRDENGIKSHPTQKPLKLIQQVILASSKDGSILRVRASQSIGMGLAP